MISNISRHERVILLVREEGDSTDRPYRLCIGPDSLPDSHDVLRQLSGHLPSGLCVLTDFVSVMRKKGNAIDQNPEREVELIMCIFHARGPEQNETLDPLFTHNLEKQHICFSERRACRMQRSPFYTWAESGNDGMHASKGALKSFPVHKLALDDSHRGIRSDLFGKL